MPVVEVPMLPPPFFFALIDGNPLCDITPRNSVHVGNFEELKCCVGFKPHSQKSKVMFKMKAEDSFRIKKYIGMSKIYFYIFCALNLKNTKLPIQINILILTRAEVRLLKKKDNIEILKTRLQQILKTKIKKLNIKSPDTAERALNELFEASDKNMLEKAANNESLSDLIHIVNVYKSVVSTIFQNGNVSTRSRPKSQRDVDDEAEKEAERLKPPPPPPQLSTMMVTFLKTNSDAPLDEVDKIKINTQLSYEDKRTKLDHILSRMNYKIKRVTETLDTQLFKQERSEFDVGPNRAVLNYREGPIVAAYIQELKKMLNDLKQKQRHVREVLDDVRRGAVQDFLETIKFDDETNKFLEIQGNIQLSNNDKLNEVKHIYENMKEKIDKVQNPLSTPMGSDDLKKLVTNWQNIMQNVATEYRNLKKKHLLN